MTVMKGIGGGMKIKTKPTKTELEGPPIPFEVIDRLLDRATPLAVRQLAKKLKAAGRRKENNDGSRKEIQVQDQEDSQA